MSSSYENQYNDNDGNIRRRESPSQKRQSDTTANFVLGQAQTGPARVINSQQSQRYTNGDIFSDQTTDAEHNKALLEKLSLDLGNLLNRTDISDCFLNVKGTFMAVHKCILAARSNAFAAVISGNFNRLSLDERNRIQTMPDTDKLTIVIDKTDPEIMKHVVIFMYTGKCDLDEGNAYPLLDAAGRYDIKDLKAHTGRFLSSRIDSNNVLMLLKAAYKYDNKLIRQRCIEYFINNAKEIMAIHEPWKKFAEEQQAIVAELLHWLVNKDEFYKAKPQWDASSRW
ncbi:unnamed protein product [Rotaria sp. Silwood2]|nr:unnamed protein product [Rotaria sp. Silwood2]CAF4099990.1 unnamed protein product [Rotaria sp. Silwood2]CAF4458982.1 unnamed protein product [Rotaria sp. Silwood2]